VDHQVAWRHACRRYPVNDPYRLQRFVDAQLQTFDRACKELREGEKRSHWMWFIFPQIQGLGCSATAQAYAISSREEAQAYLADPVLGERLRAATRIVNELTGRPIEQIFGFPDHLKFHSSMTLFTEISDDFVFHRALAQYFFAQSDPATLKALDRMK
jgi:uncharacterized protein (DUF1810 family)